MKIERTKLNKIEQKHICLGCLGKQQKNINLKIKSLDEKTLNSIQWNLALAELKELEAIKIFIDNLIEYRSKKWKLQQNNLKN